MIGACRFVCVSICVSLLLLVSLAAVADIVLDEQKLKASDAAQGDRFGRAVAIDGDTALIGAPYEDDGGTSTGAVYVFTRVGGTWSEQARLTASDVTKYSSFGRAVAIDGDTALIGAPGDDDAAIYPRSGAAYVFIRDGEEWRQQTKLFASGPADSDPDYFGMAVALDGDTALIGAFGDNDEGWNSGAAYVFTRVDGLWTERAKLIASDETSRDAFGRAVSIFGDTALIGAAEDDDDGVSSGAAYVFTRVDGVWSEQAKLTASDAATNDQFGFDVSVDNDTALIGARYQNADGVASSGAAYVFTRVDGIWSEQAKLVASDGEANDVFGSYVAIEGDTALIGADGDDDVATRSGAAYVFNRDGELWSEQAKLIASDAAEYQLFGSEVAIDGNTAVISAIWDDEGGRASGAVYAYLLDIPQLLCDINADGGYDGQDTSAFVRSCRQGTAPWLCDLNEDGRFDGRDVALHRQSCKIN